MQKKVSPLFAAVVIVVVLAVGVIWFMMRYRSYEAQEAETARALQAQRDMAYRSGRALRGLDRARSQMLRRGATPEGRRAEGRRAP